MQTLVWSSTARCGTQFAFWQTWQPGICSCLCQSSIGTFSSSGRSMIWLQVNFPVFNIEGYGKRNIQNQLKKRYQRHWKTEKKREQHVHNQNELHCVDAWGFHEHACKSFWRIKDLRGFILFQAGGAFVFLLPFLPQPVRWYTIYYLSYYLYMIHLFQMDALEGPVWHCPTFLLCDHCREGHPEDLESLPMSQKPKYYRAKCPNVPSRLNQTL